MGLRKNEKTTSKEKEQLQDGSRPTGSKVEVPYGTEAAAAVEEVAAATAAAVCTAQIASKLREWLRFGCLKRVDRRAEPETHFVDSGGKTNSHRFLRAR